MAARVDTDDVAMGPCLHSPEYMVIGSEPGDTPATRDAPSTKVRKIPDASSPKFPHSRDLISQVTFDVQHGKIWCRSNACC